MDVDNELDFAPQPAHRCLVKHYNRCRQFDKARAAILLEESRLAR